MTTGKETYLTPFEGGLMTHWLEHLYHKSIGSFGQGWTPAFTPEWFHKWYGLHDASPEATMARYQAHHEKVIDKLRGHPLVLIVVDHQQEKFDFFRQQVQCEILYQSAKTWNKSYPECREPYLTVYVIMIPELKKEGE